ncbi:hypothetical protein COT30_00580 [Candidatus Micrarchaeota archaeon CG08_land_8_20_14_0_20_49_17]|nr:MAG: hypothetical protein AUJ13_03670 [Candidatus Micrarchaeota archaeon CG1_02_49_24]PIU10172.1 MAG: hypothetical protein COT30_00580 [Candidatus Micrarchaeota archaeon CG08_land_8_20_14_0_20_49_17]PIU81490.1 MAG: hypothetical protein COS70_03825 [Candidatus Micrarchaeota archaeon CG06_land_8_20_14_3_00_50_6]PIZ99830.1 MAG: hypothetical protein COX84_00560 [Candidatus Micrarchaeota archaeon CG_4_10_14_0_2_um_filter_49_7]HII53826.1 hypothetical protein [Candidatus Micrarchaeota archaeon]
MADLFLTRRGFCRAAGLAVATLKLPQVLAEGAQKPLTREQLIKEAATALRNTSRSAYDPELGAIFLKSSILENGRMTLVGTKPGWDKLLVRVFDSKKRDAEGFFEQVSESACDLGLKLPEGRATPPVIYTHSDFYWTSEARVIAVVGGGLFAVFMRNGDGYKRVITEPMQGVLGVVSVGLAELANGVCLAVKVIPGKITTVSEIETGSNKMTVHAFKPEELS